MAPLSLRVLLEELSPDVQSTFLSLRCLVASNYSTFFRDCSLYAQFDH